MTRSEGPSAQPQPSRRPGAHRTGNVRVRGSAATEPEPEVADYDSPAERAADLMAGLRSLGAASTGSRAATRAPRAGLASPAGLGGMVGDMVVDTLDTATGRLHREDPVLPGTGGPAGNSRLTSWTGLLLLVLLAVEGGTLLALRQLVSVHIIVGALLLPPVLLKTGSTGWRIVRYYLHNPSYRQAGPPPMLLRLLGPLVILSTLAVIGTGIALAVQGAAGLTPLLVVAGIGLSMLTLHQATFVIWFVIMTAHVLSRTIPALQVTMSRAGRALRVAGGSVRLGLLAGSLAVGIALAVLVLHDSGMWTSHILAHR